MKDKESNNRELKIKREMEQLFFKPIIVSIDDVDKYEQEEMKKIRPINNTWHDWLINYTPEPITKIVGGFEERIVSLFNTDTPKQTVYAKKLSKPETQSKIRNPFILKKKLKIK